MKRVAAGAVLTWLVLGLFGAFSYAHNYLVYRGFNPPHDPPHVLRGQAVNVAFRSRALRHKRSYLIYLPAGYAAAAARGVRFPVLYLLHGSPGWPKQFIDIAQAGVLQDELLARGQVRPFLIVMPNGSDGTYMTDTEWANTAHGRYESFVLDVVQAVDARWPTEQDRAFRAIAGNSEGAYGAVNVALRNLDTFGVLEAWSGYYKQQHAGPFRRATAAALQANSPATYVGQLAPRLRTRPLHAFVYTAVDDRYRAQSLAFAKALARAGADVTFGSYPGRHDWRLWRDRAPDMLQFADRWLSAGARR